MQLSFLKNTLIALAAITLAGSLASCVKNKFDAPAAGSSDPAGIHATMSIRQFKDNYFIYSSQSTNPFPFQINDSVILSGIVNGDDKSGNIYKTIVFQDSTGGLQIAADVSDLYNTYPTGTRIFVKCKGLYLYNYLGTLQLGSYTDTTRAQPALGAIPKINLSTYVIKGQTGLTVTPKIWTLANLVYGSDLYYDQSTLVQLDSVQFTSQTDTMPYADAIHKGFGNLVLTDCGPYTATVRSSGYADFATARPSTGRGTVVGIFTIYQSGSTSIAQLAIRDTTDLQLTGPRKCR